MENELIKFKIPNLYFNISSRVLTPDYAARKMHHHKAIELVRIYSGEVTCYVGQKAFPLKVGTIFLIHSHVPHRLEINATADITYMQIELNTLTDSAEVNDFPLIDAFIAQTQYFTYSIFTEETALAVLFDKLKAEAETSQPYASMFIKAYIMELSALMYRQGIISNPALSGIPHFEQLSPAIAFIDQSYDTKLSLDAIASVINCDRYQLCRLFKAVTGNTVVNYINFVRLIHATRLLSGTQNISEVAFSCGFSSSQYFNKVFKKQFGCTPKEFRDSYNHF